MVVNFVIEPDATWLRFRMKVWETIDLPMRASVRLVGIPFAPNDDVKVHELAERGSSHILFVSRTALRASHPALLLALGAATGRYLAENRLRC